MLTEAPPFPRFEKPPPRRIPAYKLGPNMAEWQTSTGRVRDIVWLDEDDVAHVLATFQAQGVVLPIFKEHRKEEGSFGAMRLLRADDGGLDQEWELSPQGQALVASGRWMFDSPELVVERKGDGRLHIREIRSGSLVNQPARTGSQPLLMSGAAMNEYVMTARKAMEHLGGLEGCVKTMSGATHEKIKAAAEMLAPVMGPAIAHLQSAIEDLDRDNMAAQAPEPPQKNLPGATVSMSAAMSETLDLGVQVLKMTGASSAAGALGKLEAQLASMESMKGLLLELGAQAGIQGLTGDAERFKGYEPARLVAYMSAAPRIAPTAPQPTESEASAASKYADVEAEVDKMLTRALAKAGVQRKG